MVLLRPEDISGETANPAYASYQTKTPKRSLEFCDGILEEYSTDEEDANAEPTQEVVDPSTMAWGPWMLYKTWAAGNSTICFIDYIGEALASFFGITTPRYYFELEEYKRRKLNEETQMDQEKGWLDQKHDVIEVPLKTIHTNSSQSRPEEV